MQKLEISDKTLRIYGGDNQDILMQSIVLKEIKGFKIDSIEQYLTTLTLFTQWGENTITVKHEEANCLINRLSDVLEDNRIQIPELTGDTIVLKVNRFLTSEESSQLAEEYELALGKKVIIFDKSIEIVGSVRNKEEHIEETENEEPI